MKRLFDETTPHILIVDDDTRIRNLLQKFLLEHGFRTSIAADAADAQSKMEALQFDAIVLDIMMPGMDGIAFTRKLRRKNNQVPILLLTALGEVEQRIEGLEHGADDYLPKPFSPEELLLRLRNLCRRSASPEAASSEPEIVHFGDFSYHIQHAKLLHKGARITLTTREAALLSKLARAQGRAVARAELLADDDTSERAIDVQINRLRTKIETHPREPLYIQTVRGRGYILRSL